MGRWTPHWQRVVIHHSAGRDTPGHLDAAAIRRFHVAGRGWQDIGYHFLVEALPVITLDGSPGFEYVAVAGRPLTKWGAHTPGLNGEAIGVCLVGDFTEEPPPAGQLEVAADLVAGLLHTAGVPTWERPPISPHRDHKATECPGLMFPWGEFAGMVAKRWPA